MAIQPMSAETTVMTCTTLHFGVENPASPERLGLHFSTYNPHRAGLNRSVDWLDV